MFLAAFVVWFVASNLRRRSAGWRRLQLGARVSLGILLVVLPAVEFSHRAMPRIAGERGDHLVVIGDSISSGIDPRIPAWPVVMTQLTGIPVKTLAQPGLQMMNALPLVEKVTPDDQVVLIELGGNDMLSGVPARRFERGLDTILAHLVARGRTIVMFELPLLPDEIAYGQVQRRLSAKYGVFLIPKHCFASVISGTSATSDGLHLSGLGARRMALLVARVVAPVLRNQKRVTFSPVPPFILCRAKQGNPRSTG